MLRRAVIQHLKVNVSDLGGRVYQAFLAPANAVRPYATVKITGVRGSPGISYAGAQPVDVRLYGDPDSFIALDTLERSVIDTLHGAEIIDQNDGERYYLQWAPGAGDFIDEEKNLIGRLVTFEAAFLQEPK